ncbi:tRNA 2-thiouridine(34) synthase MnmA [bacterium]|nr:tRNA 2-thiouridine(34) synthase MnmA [bacterium]
MKIAVALSGGMDSAIVAHRYLQDGHEVMGLTMRLCPDLIDLPLTPKTCAQAQVGLEEPGCSQGVAPCACLDATRIARRLGIQHEILDFRDDFERLVIDPFIRDFSQGLTPNPCAICNLNVKFGLLLEHAFRLGAEALATGHYACLQKEGDEIHLCRGKDRNKDQTYFLSLVPQTRFDKVLFPLCDTTKQEIAVEAQKAGLILERSETSNEICFLRELSYPDFLRQRVPEAFVPGEIVDTNGCVVGEHQGLLHYTIGQRRGIGVAAAHPLYVIRLRKTENQVVVGSDEALLSRDVHVRELNWPETLPRKAGEVQAMIRYRQTPRPARLRFSNEQEASLHFEQPIRAVTPGQIVAIYDQERLLGGGRIAANQE